MILKGGVDLWASGREQLESSGYESDNDEDSSLSDGISQNDDLLEPTWQAGKQSICDGVLEIVAVFGSWHLGQLTVGLSRATRLRQGKRITIKTSKSLPMQVDGEPFMQEPCVMSIEKANQARVLRKVDSEPVAAVVRAVEEALEEATSDGTISIHQHDKLSRDLARKLHQL